MQAAVRFVTAQVWSCTARSVVSLLTLGLAFHAGPLQAEDAPDLKAPVDLLHPPGKFYEAAGQRIYLHCLGTGSPTVVIDAGIGASSLEWLPVQRLVSTETRTCAWDRPGYGWSDPGPGPRATPQIADELLAVLSAAHIEPPYVFVGHSFGGYTARYLAASRPELTAAVALIESSTPSTEIAIKAAGQRVGRPNPLVPISDAETYGVPKDIEGQASYLNTRRKAIFAQMDELRNFHASGEAVLAAGALPAVPLRVLMREHRVWPEGVEGDQAEVAWLRAQQELATLSPAGRLLILPGAGHSPHVDAPQAVANALIELVQTVRE